MRHLASWAVVVAAATLLSSCKRDEDTHLLVKVSLQEGVGLTGAVSLRVTVDDADRRETKDYPSNGPAPIAFPTSLSVQLSPQIRGPLRIEVVALGALGAMLARGTLEHLEINPGQRNELSIVLRCLSGCVAGPPVDAATDGPAADAGVDGERPQCGNGEVDPDELCDTAITPGLVGACPPAGCDDGQACTRDIPTGSGCTLSCRYEPIAEAAAGDGCCPAQATFATDSDCSPTCGNGAVEIGEACDLAIAAGAPGACPTATGCDDHNPCTEDLLLSPGTCAATCVHRVVTVIVGGDLCCPAGADSRSDPDCPAVCGNGIKEVAAGETCDRGPKSRGLAKSDACPDSCDDDEPCTVDTLVGSGCRAECHHTAITETVGGDRCCPSGATRDVDPDCPAVCGNGVVEPGEACDKAIGAGSPGACPTTCPDHPAACVRGVVDGRADDCSARCTTELVTLCLATSDGCCPSGCASGDDPDCSATCGNGVVEVGETCDTAITPGAPGSCPTACDDGAVCTQDVLASRGTCQAQCAFAEIMVLDSGDGCCPPGGNGLLDDDCAAVCGNGLVEGPTETCDIGRTGAGGCATVCPQLPGTCHKSVRTGDDAACTGRCTVVPVTACTSGDGCCPMGCNRLADSDCASICGNAVVEPGETCDYGITAGNPGACPAICDDQKACTEDKTFGNPLDCTRFCDFAPRTVCRAGDGCCPAGCTVENDGDCAPPACGNAKIEAGETCDPRSTCPTRCPDDGDACTADVISGDGASCTAACVHKPITACSGATQDGCCPTGCTPDTDGDCQK